MYSTKILDYSSSSSTSRNFRSIEQESYSNTGLGGSSRFGDRLLQLGNKEPALSNNRICTIQPFYKLLPSVMLRILTRQHVLYFFVASTNHRKVGLLDCVVREEEYLPISIGLIVLLVVVYVLKVAMTVSRFQKHDRSENEQFATELQSDGNETEKSRQDLVVGSIVRVHPDQEFPADVIPLYSENGPRIRISTLNLDKQLTPVTKLISNQIVATITSPKNIFQRLRNLEIAYERPNNSFYSFEGKVASRVQNSSYELLTYDHLILRGSQLREEHPVICVVLYAGNDCKKFVTISNRNRGIMRVTLLHKELEEEIPATLILASALVFVGIIVYMCRYFSKFKQSDTENMGFVNKHFFYMIVLEFLCYLNVLHVWVFLMIELVRWLQLRIYQQKQPTVVNNLCQSLDQLGRARTVIADQRTLFGVPQFIYKEGDNLVSPNPQLTMPTLRSILLSSDMFREMYAQEAEALQRWLRDEKRVKEKGIEIRRQQVSPDNKALYLVVKLPRDRYFLIQVVNQRDLYYSPSSDESLLMEPITERIRDEKRKGSRILALLTKEIDEQECQQELVTFRRQPSEYEVSGSQISSLFDHSQTLIARNESELRFACVMVFCYTIGQEVSQFAQLILRNDTHLWIITDRSLTSIEEILTSAGVQDHTTSRLIIDRLDTNELKDHLKYVDGLLSKNQSQHIQSILYVSCDSLYAFSKAEVQHVLNVITQLHEIARKCVSVVCFNYNNFLRERLHDCFTHKSKGVVFLSQFFVESNLMLQADVSVSIITEASSRQAKVADFQVMSVLDLGRLMCRSGRLAYRRNCQLAYCLIFGNSLLVGCQLFLDFIALPFTPIVLYYQYEIAFYNILMFSLPLIAYCTVIGSSDNQQAPQTKYSSWAVWRLVMAATTIGMLISAINFSWVLGSTSVFDMKVTCFLNCMILGNLFIGLVALAEPIARARKLVVWALILLDLGIFCLWIIVVNSIDETNWHNSAELFIDHRFFTIPCLLISNAVGGVLCFTYLQLWPLTNRQNRNTAETKQVRTSELQCRLAAVSKGRTVHLQD